MNKENNKLILSGIATLTAGIALIYTLIVYHHVILAVIGLSIVFLITAYILIRNLIAYSSMKNKSLDVHLKECINDLSTQLEAINNAQAQIGKATYLYTRQAAQTVTTLEQNYMESQDALYKNLASLSNLQNKAAKLMIKNDQKNTVKIISTIRDMRNHINETMVQGFDQIQPNTTEIINMLEDIVTYLKSQPNTIDQSVAPQLDNVAHELQNISNSVQQLQMPASDTEEAFDTAGEDTVDTANEIDQNAADMTPQDENTVTVDVSDEAIADETSTVTEDVSDEAIADEISTVTEDVSDEAIPDEISTVTEDVSVSQTDETADDQGSMEEDNTDLTENDNTDTKQVPTIGDLPENPNKQLSPDEIAALFASLG